jgi:hypothetical protein
MLNVDVYIEQFTVKILIKQINGNNVFIFLSLGI